MKQQFHIGGQFRLFRFYNDVLVSSYWFPNGLTTAGINQLFNDEFRNGTTPAAWYMGLIDNESFTALAIGDTMGSHADWIENTDYDEATRPAWSPAESSSRKIENTSSVQFTMNAAVTIKGLFIASDNTKGGTSETLWATGVLPIAEAVQSGSVFRGFYSLTGNEG